MNVELGQRGTALFSDARLQEIVQTTVLPELDDSHSLVVVSSITDGGAKAALVFRKKTTIGEWRLEAAFEHDFHTNTNEAAARVIFKL